MLPLFFMPAEKRENCDASVCTRVFLRARRPPFCGQKLRPPLAPSSPKNVFPGLSCVRRSPCDIRKNVRMLTKKIRFIHLAASYTRRAPKDCEALSGTFA